MAEAHEPPVVVITGATSGIGAAVADRFAEMGAAAIVIGGRNPTAAREGVDRVAASGAEATAHVGDIADPTYCQGLIELAVSRFGRVDVLVNAAGMIVRADAVATTDADWAATMAVNVSGVFYTSRAAVAAMRQGDGGVIVNVASNVGLVGAPGLAAYCASKGAVVTLTKAMALDHADEGIRINAVCPGAVDTPMLVSGHEPDRTPESVLAANAASIPQGRVATSAEIADAVAFLASAQASHITGIALPVDGGYLAR